MSNEHGQGNVPPLEQYSTFSNRAPKRMHVGVGNLKAEWFTL